MAEAQPSTAYTYEEYLALEQSSQERYEYYFGKVRAMAGGTHRHGRIARNLAALLESHRQDMRCSAYLTDTKLEIAPGHAYYYPDVMFSCHPEDTLDDTRHSIRHPLIIAEILSDSTEDFDRNGKFKSYMSIASLRYYVLIAQQAPVAEVFSRQTHDFWHYRRYEGLDARIEFPELNISLDLRELYDRVALDAPASPD